MDQTVVQKPKRGNNKLWIGCLVAALIGFCGLMVLAGGAYYFGYFPSHRVPVLATEPGATAVQSTTKEATALATTPAAQPAQSTSSVTSASPKVEPYDLNSNVQYPVLTTLADGAGNVTILPNQPTILETHWCAKGDSTLSKMTSILDPTISINDTKAPVSSFNLSKYQTTLEINGKKESAVCNTITGLIRNWAEGDYTVKLSVRATAAYNDGWKDHPADEVQELTYRVKVTPSSASVEWGRCQSFEKLQMELVFLDPKLNQPLGFYIKFDNGVPGFEKEISGDTGDFQYNAAIDHAASDTMCTYDKGYPGRLYCKVKLLSNYSKTIRPVTLSVNGCSWPVYLNPDAEIP